MSNSSFLPIDRNLTGATTPSYCGPGSKDNDVEFSIPQSPRITGALLSECLISYPGHSLGNSIPFAKMQSVYS